MNKISKYIYITIGLISFVVGAIGIILPVLPTTPFLLLASVCFAKGSDRINNWFINTTIYKKHLESFVREKAMTLKQKVCILAFTTFMLSIPIVLLDNLHVRIFLIVLVFLKLYYFSFRVKTTKPQIKEYK